MLLLTYSDVKCIFILDINACMMNIVKHEDRKM